MRTKLLITISALILVSISPSRAFAQAAEAKPDDLTDTISTAPDGSDEVVVVGRAEDLLGIAGAGSEGHVGAAELEDRPLLRPGEVLETVPGLIVTQHSGSGKANQYFLRGFNLDHGLDFATSIDGMPVNLVSHAHGQGYTDLNFLIPELVESIDYKKGTYYAENGDLSSAGSADIHLVTKLDKGLAQVTTGSYGYNRLLVADSPMVEGNPLLYAFEGEYNDGPFDFSEHIRKANGLLRYSNGTQDNGATVTFSGYHNEWDSTDQIASRAVDEGIIDRLGSLDPSDGGYTTRFSLFGDWREHDNDGATKVNLYTYYYKLDLFSNFTYDLEDPVNGDQFEQKDRRVGVGGKASHDWYAKVGGINNTLTLGLQTRNDFIPQVAIEHTNERARVDTVSDDSVIETSGGTYGQIETQWLEKFRTVLGLRGDLYYFDVDSNVEENAGDRTAGILSPKFQAILGPWDKTEFYLDAGDGFHSNDARGTTIQVEPTDPTKQIDAGSPLVRSKGAEVGVRSSIVPGLNTTFALWILDLDSELVFSGDSGDTEPDRPSRRYGFEFTNFYKPISWMSVDADWSLSRARFTESDPVGDYVPEAIESALNSGVKIDFGDGYFGGLRYRLFGPRALIEDNSVRSNQTSVFNGLVGYRYQDWQVGLELLNILDQHDHDIDYYYPSRLPGEPAEGVNDIHYHPMEPRQVRLTLAYRF